jgi:hypothetical protein
VRSSAVKQVAPPDKHRASNIPALTPSRHTTTLRQRGKLFASMTYCDSGMYYMFRLVEEYKESPSTTPLGSTIHGYPVKVPRGLDRRQVQISIDFTTASSLLRASKEKGNKLAATFKGNIQQLRLRTDNPWNNDCLIQR